MDNITLDDLRSYFDIKTAIKSLLEEVQMIEEGTYRPGVLRGKSSNHGRSDPTAKKAHQLVEVRRRLEKKIREYEDLTDRIERFTVSIEDPIVMTSIRWHYLHGESWQKTSVHIYGYPNGDLCRMTVKRFFERMETQDAENKTTIAL